MRKLLRRLWYVLRQRQFEADLAEEMAVHREMAQQELAQLGAALPDARLGAERRLGSAALARDRSRDVWLPPALQDISGDVRLAVRLLTKDRGFTVRRHHDAGARDRCSGDDLHDLRRHVPEGPARRSTRSHRHRGRTRPAGSAAATVATGVRRVADGDGELPGSRCVRQCHRRSSPTKAGLRSVCPPPTSPPRRSRCSVSVRCWAGSSRPPTISAERRRSSSSARAYGRSGTVATPESSAARSRSTTSR